MSTAPSAWRLDLCNNAQAPLTAAVAVDEFCRRVGLSAHDTLILRLIAEELVVNTVTHGQAAPCSAITLSLRVWPEHIDVTYADAGIPFNPLHELSAVVPDLPLPERVPGGLGWPLICHYCQTISYRRENERNCLHLVQRLRRPLSR